MENAQFQKHVLDRIRKLEEKEFGGTYEERYTPRQQAKRISDDDSKEHHIGKKSPQVLRQELESHIQSEQETFTKDERKQWKEKKQSLIDQLREATKN